MASTTPQDFKEYIQKSAGHAEQATSDAVVGMLAKFFTKISEPKKPVIGDYSKK